MAKSMQLKYITLKQLLSWSPCDEWTEQRILHVTGGRRRLSPLEICDLAGVSARDKLWVLLREKILTEHELRLFACWCADRALRAETKAGRNPDKRSCAAVQIARAFAHGKATTDQLAEAESAAWTAWTAVEPAARESESAARSAARSSASASESAAWAARSAAARAAERAARLAAEWAARTAGSAESAVQLQHLKQCAFTRQL